MRRLTEEMTFEEISQVLSDPCFPEGDNLADFERLKIMLKKMDIIDELIQDIENAGRCEIKERMALKIESKANTYFYNLLDRLNEDVSA